MPVLQNQDQEMILNEILDTPLSDRSISDLFSLGATPTGGLGVRRFNAPETPDSSIQGGRLPARRHRLESADMDFDCLDSNNNQVTGVLPPIGSPLRAAPGSGGTTRLQRLNPGLTLDTLSGYSLDGDRSSAGISSPWFDSPSLTPMTPQIVRSPFDANFSSNSYGAGSSPFGSHSLDSCSPPYHQSGRGGGGDDSIDFSPYYTQGGGDYFSYNGHAPSHHAYLDARGGGGGGGCYNYAANSGGGGNHLNASMTDSSNIENIDELLASLALNNTGWTNLHNLAAVCANSQLAAASGSGGGGGNNGGSNGGGLDTYAFIAAQYYDNLKRHRELVYQLDSVLASLITPGGGTPGAGTSSSLNSPLTSPRTSPSSAGARYGARGGGDLYSGGGGDGTGVQSTLDQAARHHRSSANSQIPQKSWEGSLPLRTSFTDELLSNKIFLGGVPWDTPEYLLLTVFAQFGPVKVEWPQGTPESPSAPKGFAYLVYDSAASAKAMLDQCAFDGQSYYYKIPSRKRGRENQGSMVRSFKDVEVVPWAISDSNYSPQGHSTKLEPGKTIFVGALHGRLTAQALYQVMNELFGDVVYAGIDTDKHKYPIGSGRITFGSTRAYSDAIRAAFIEVKSGRICKKLQIDPYLEDNVCSECQTHSGPYFCREGICYRYFCRSCWLKVHIGDYAQHEPIVRNVRKSPPSSPSGPSHQVGPASLASFGSLLSRSSLI